MWEKSGKLNLSAGIQKTRFDAGSFLVLLKRSKNVSWFCKDPSGHHFLLQKVAMSFSETNQERVRLQTLSRPRRGQKDTCSGNKWFAIGKTVEEGTQEIGNKEGMYWEKWQETENQWLWVVRQGLSVLLAVRPRPPVKLTPISFVVRS